MDTVTKTDIEGKPIIERRNWSFSALEKFSQCPKRFHAYDVAKIVREPESEAMRIGFRVHKAMADRISKGIPLPADLARYDGWIKQALNNPSGAQVLVEQKLACTFELKPCEYFSRADKVWLRTVADLLVISGDHCKSWDWKTGQEKDDRYEVLPSNYQLKLVALTVFLHYPQINQVDSAYIYLTTGAKVEFTMKRYELKHFIPAMYDIVGGLQKAVRANDFPCRPSGLCKRHCGVTACEYHGRGAY
jgi:hypothetical protein